ncbi:ABC transporter ATP-binding protein [Methylophilus aquaticus]|uniref:ABC transporter ATP-binding protein n=2 Tax=Methylophilus aquaticus TaxID=1971610 RepID=A0ABT9JW81_9PROT|nr:ABC transporter ATP-binding protein [Methylophilus aquaticus]MDP8568822.1 ABC transporter ATP-binding protein [Methylophilus aquaticus]
MVAAVDIQGITKKFGQFEALRGVDLQIAQGEFFALLGPNGAGKSTLINLIAGLLRPSSGSIRIMGHDVQSDYQQARMALGVVPQELVFDPFFNVREMLRFQAGYFGRGPENDAWVDEVIEGLGLTDKAHSNMRKLSGGMKRRALIAQALAHKPDVIVLDEPTAGVDVELRQMLWRFIQKLNQQGHTIILTTHYLEEAETLCERVAMMKSGKIVALDTTRALLKNHAGKQLTLRLSGALPIDLQAWVKQQQGDEVVLNVTDLWQVETVLARLRAAQVSVLDMQLQEMDLEDVFMNLVGSHGGSVR